MGCTASIPEAERVAPKLKHDVDVPSLAVKAVPPVTQVAHGTVANEKQLSFVAIAGSSRYGAYSGKLLAVAVEAARKLGAEVTTVDLRALALPEYDQDLENKEGVPAGAKQLRDVLAKADGAIVVTPEYNGFPTPLFLN